MSTYGGSVPWWRVVRADGSLPPSHDEEARAHYLRGGHAAAALRAGWTWRGPYVGGLHAPEHLRPGPPACLPCARSTDVLPVTVSITRHVEPDRVDQMVAWVRAGSSLAERFPGFLGTGWVRPSGGSDEWHMLYRFDSAESLGGWEASDQRAWWLGSAQGLVGESLRERRTGIEGWFDQPHGARREDLRPPPAAPPRWKQAVMIWTAFFPLSLLTGLLLRDGAPRGWHWCRGCWSPPCVMTPVMTYVVLPAADPAARVVAAGTTRPLASLTNSVGRR